MQKTTTYLLFVGEQNGKAEEAISLYTSLFRNSGVKHMEYFKAGEPGGEEGTVKQAIFTLDGQEYRAMDGGVGHHSALPRQCLFSSTARARRRLTGCGRNCWRMVAP